MRLDRLRKLEEEVNEWQSAIEKDDAIPATQDAAGDVEGVLGGNTTTDATGTPVEAAAAHEVDLLEHYAQKAREFSEKTVEAPKEDHRLAELMETIRALKGEIEDMKTRKPVDPVEFELDAEFVDEYPDLAKQVKKAAGMAAAEAKRESDVLRKQLDEIKSKFTATEQQSTITTHQQLIQKNHPDLNEFFTGGKYAAPLGAWAMEQPTVFKDIIQNPLSYSPDDVSYVLSKFKSDVRLKSADAPKEPKKPASGDVAINVHNRTTNIEPTTGPAPLTAKELQDLPRLASKLKHDPKALAALMERLDVTTGGR